MKDSKEEKVWRSIKFPVDLVKRIEKDAKEERRSFSAQAMVLLESAISARDDILSGKTQINMEELRKEGISA